MQQSQTTTLCAKPGYNIVMLGDFDVGKTCLLERFVNHQYVENFQASIGTDMFYKGTFIEQQPIKLALCDIRNPDRYTQWKPSFYKNTSGLILNYDVSNRKSFENISYWIKEIEEFAQQNSIKILFGNKCDSQSRQVSYEEGKQLADQLGIKFFETSSKQDVNVEEAFMTLARDIFNQFGETVCNLHLEVYKPRKIHCF